MFQVTEIVRFLLERGLRESESSLGPASYQLPGRLIKIRHWQPPDSESEKVGQALSRRGRELLERSCACTARQQDRDMNRRATNSRLVTKCRMQCRGLPFYPGPLAFSEEISTSILSSSHGQVPSTTSTVRPNTEEQRLDPGPGATI